MSPQRERTRAVLRRLVVLSGGALVRRRAAARALGEVSETEATQLLSELLELAAARDDDALEILPAFLRALEEDGDVIPHLSTLRRVAGLHQQDDVELLFAEGEAVRQYHVDAAARADARLFTLPLGVLKTRARLTRNPDELSRLAVASNPSVVREVLRNSRLTEDLVVRIAARRPARPEPLVEIWRSTRWSLRPAVRRALAFNPYLPPEVGVKIVPLLPRVDLEQLLESPGLHASLRELASTLLRTG
ncbi:MAG: hypothetical protein IT380_16015 [Myxococcales bacterium]|nr:hypothetical protein [Myxococcales bacterium]